MTSRERVIAAINHRQPDRVPVDLGATNQTGIGVSALYRLRALLELEQKPLDVFELMQMIGEVDEDLRQALDIDVIGLCEPVDAAGIAGFPGAEKKLFHMPDGVPARILAGNAVSRAPDGGVYLHPQGDAAAPPSLYMPAGGCFFDAIDRAPEVDEAHLTPREDFKAFFSLIDDRTARYYEEKSKRLYADTAYAVVGNWGGASFGDPGALPAPFEKAPRGIRQFEQWCMAQLLYPDYVHAVFEMQTAFALKNLEIYRQAVGERIQVIAISGTDFGTQNSALMSRATFRSLYKPYYKRVCDWIHQHTGWKTELHSCGSVVDLLDDFIEMGVDILNPVQLSAKGMDAQTLKETYGDKLVFWGGGVDTQQTLPYGTPDEVRAQVRERLGILSKGGGYVFAAVHNIIGDTPAENIAAMYEAIRAFNRAQ